MNQANDEYEQIKSVYAEAEAAVEAYDQEINDTCYKNGHGAQHQWIKHCYCGKVKKEIRRHENTFHHNEQNQHFEPRLKIVPEH